MKKIVIFFLLLLNVTYIHATHNRAGEITYTYISGNTYSVTVTTYTKESSAQADRCSLTVYFGDGDSATFQRSNGSTINTVGDPTCPYYGQSLGNDIKKNVYSGLHTYPGSGDYIISISDPNRNSGICNIPNSEYQSFYLQTELIINPLLGVNSSPVLLNPPIDNACVGQCFKHNPGAYDVNGDSLVYSLVSSYANGQPIAGWSMPPNMSYSSIDALKGDLVWCSPPVVCQYNVAILIEEWRRLPGSTHRYYVGSVLRDMQINVNDCPLTQNHPPQIKNVNDTCVTAGSNLHFVVKATDPDNDKVKLTATGGPFQLTPAATFTPVPTFSTTATETFNWNTNCSHVQLLPYLVTFKAIDNSPDTLADYKTVNIRVVAPAPTSLTATPTGASIVLNWNAVSCNSTQGSNPLVSYNIYRKNSCDPWTHGPCETGVPGSTGYSQIGTTAPGVTTFTDNNNGQGLTIGIDYSYIIVATYNDGSQSFASLNVCAKLKRDVPIITNVSVMSTGAKDSIWIHWVPPVADANNLDTIADPPVYEVRLMQANGTGSSVGPFSQIATYTYTAFWKMNDTGFVSTRLNTSDSAYTYRVDFYSNGNFVGSTNTASSVYLQALPDDKKIEITWNPAVPWVNYKYYIYKETSPSSGIFKLLDSTYTNTYTDTGLLNRRIYCYKIVTVGKFSDTTIIHPLYNNSQIICAAPIDRTAPCQPDILSISSDCETAAGTVTWKNPMTYCADDVFKYYIYFTPTLRDSLQRIDSIFDLNKTTFTYYYLYEGRIPSAAGCYAITAIDSSNNESPIVTRKCTDNCPVYNLPNVFTPNGDGVNDFFKPILPYRYIKNIDIKIYNRWGIQLFETTDPDIWWDGRNTSTKKICPDGVYYYICTVNEITLFGIVPHTIKGFIHLIDEEH